MTTFGLVHGAFHGAWCWELLAAELRTLGHETVAMDLPCDDPAAGNQRYAEVVVEALSGRGPVTLVGHSLGGLTIPLVAAARPVERMVFLCARIPIPGQSSEALFGEPGVYRDAPEETWPLRGDDGLMDWPAERVIPVIYPDCPEPIAAWAASRLRRQSTTPYSELCPLDAWPDTPSSYILCHDDLLVGPDRARRVARELLGTFADELPGGHSPFLAQPVELATLLDRIAHGGAER